MQNITFGMYIKLKRIYLNLRQKEVASMLDISLSSYQRIESDTSNPSLDVLKKLSRVLNFSIDEALGVNNLVQDNFKIEDLLKILDLIKN